MVKHNTHHQDHMVNGMTGKIFTTLLFLLVISTQAWATFTTFESGQVRPLAMSPDGSRLYAVNTPDGTLEVFDVKDDGLTRVTSVPVGLEPVAVAVRNNNEVWVVNHLSDNVSIVDVSSSPPRVTRVLLVGDEPRDIVFAGPGGNRAFITTAHRGQNSPWCGDSTDPKCLFPDNPGQTATPGVGRADVWVFDATNLGTDLGGNRLTLITLFTDTPRALAVSPDGNTVYAAGFHTGNKTAVINEGAVCNGGDLAPACNPSGGLAAPGGLPAPNENRPENLAQPEVGLVVKHNGTNWVDEKARIWDNQVRFSLPDKDVFIINAAATPPIETGFLSGVGTVIFNMVANPNTGKLYVSNTEARNEVRFEGVRPTSGPGSTTTTVQGHLHEARITVIDGTSVTPRHLNKHIDYTVRPAPAGIKEKSLATPNSMAVSSDGATLYVAAFGSSKVGIFNTATLENNSFTPDSANHISVTGGGPSGLALDEARNRLYVLTRFDNAISVINTTTNTEQAHLAMHNPEPSQVVNGRPFLYNAMVTSSNGEASCSSCHIFGDLDSLAWDLGDPEEVELSNPNPGGGGVPFHPMKGPMTTQSLRGLDGHGPLHWRGDRTAARSGGSAFDERNNFVEFNVAIVGLNGDTSQLSTADMGAFADFVLEISYPPNPNRNLDDALTTTQQASLDFFKTAPSTAGTLTCDFCHQLNPATGNFGSNGRMSVEGETQRFKIPHLRNMYQKVGMFGMPSNTSIIPGDGIFMGDQIRGFGFLHNGSVDSLFRFHGAPLFTFPLGDSQRRDMEQFMMVFDSNLKPIVGQGITLSNSNLATVTPRLNLLDQLADMNHGDVIVKGTVGGQQRGFVRIGSTFTPDKASETPLSVAQMRGLAATPGQELLFYMVPPGSGGRMGIDRDEDSILDGDDRCPANADPGQADGESDGSGDACDNCTALANGPLLPDAGGFSQRDSNGDGFGNRCDADLNNDNFTNSLDLGLMATPFFTSQGNAGFDEDADLNGDGIINSLDLGLMQALFFQTPGPSALVP